MFQQVIAIIETYGVRYDATTGTLTVGSSAKIKELSDGYHTMNELYEHRQLLWIALCAKLRTSQQVWRSRRHSDGSSYDGWFVLGISDSMTYHLPMSKWTLCDFAETLELGRWDGHNANDVLDRLRAMIANEMG